MDPNLSAYARPQDSVARELQSLLLLAAGAAWAVVAYRAFAETRRLEARRRLHFVSDRLLRQVFPDGTLA